jgi:hypothetical protein
MTKEEVIAMSRKAGFMLRSESVVGESDWWECFDEEIESFAKLVVEDYNNKHSQLWQVCIEDVVKAEREACAKVCDDIDAEYGREDVLATWCAKAIRARGSV